MPLSWTCTFFNDLLLIAGSFGSLFCKAERLFLFLLVDDHACWNIRTLQKCVCLVFQCLRLLPPQLLR